MTSTPIDYPYLRRIRVELTGPTHGSGGEIYESDGTQNNLRISARIRKRNTRAGDPASISFWNMSIDSRNKMRKSFDNEEGTKIRVYAGWDHGRGEDLSQCFYGEFLNSQSTRNGADIITTVLAQSSVDTLATKSVNIEFDPTMVVADAIYELASSLDRVNVDRKRIVGLDYQLGAKWIYADKVSNILDALSKAYAFYWSINDGIFIAASEQADRNVVAVLEKPYLIDASPVLASVRQYDVMVQWQTIYNPFIYPLAWVEIKSDVMREALNGTYQVIDAVHVLDTFEEKSFTTSGHSYIPSGQ